ncbi:METTL5 family protein [Halovenus rubra]|uniref:METTL5 family protein n=2 Tax=Halovenus rubra TaxID=869890 RepID=A0ACC7DZH0_9EURY|nr:METTL5 family protein [Halovenus rubra]
MASKRELAKQLGRVTGFEQPSPELEQYRTPPEIAATVVQTAALQGDISGQIVVDIGCGTGMLALASAFCGPEAVIGADIDGTVLETAKENERQFELDTPTGWVRADVTDTPFCPPADNVTVVMNPPFGAQDSNEHADRPFLNVAAEIADVSYSIHNQGSLSFVESFAGDRDGSVTHAFEAKFDLPPVFEFHTEKSKLIDVEVFRIEW